MTQLKTLYNNKTVFIQTTLMGKNRLFKMGLSQAANKLSLISKLKLLGSLYKMKKSLNFMLQSQVSK